MGGMDGAGVTSTSRCWSSTTTPMCLASFGTRLTAVGFGSGRDGRRQGLSSATENRPDAVVLGINMPVLDGVSVVTALRDGQRRPGLCAIRTLWWPD